MYSGPMPGSVEAIHISAVESQLPHAVEAVAALVSADRGVVPPTANHVRTDLPVDVVAGEARTVERAPAVSTSFAFGGHNVALVLAPV